MPKLNERVRNELYAMWDLLESEQPNLVKLAASINKLLKWTEPKPSNRNNKRVEVDGIKFDSQMEADYYLYLLAQQALDPLLQITLQPRFVLQDGYIDAQGKKVRPIEYRADFQIFYPFLGTEVIDVKGNIDAQFKIKKKMFDTRYPHVRLRLVTRCPKKYGKEWIDVDELQKLRKKAKK